MKFNRLNRVPKTYDGHIWADYLELRCLDNPDGQVTLAEIEDFLEEQTDVGEPFALLDVDGDGEPDLPEAAEPADSNEDDEVEVGSVAALRNDQKISRVADWFVYIAQRAEALGDAYPFRIADGGTTIELQAALTDVQRLYIFLLLCANLRYVRNWAPLPHAFEAISARGMRQLLPPNSEVYQFGAGGDVVRYTGNLWAKIHRLAEDVCDKVIADECEFKASDVGDGGLDIVGWAPLPDNLPSRLILFGQCACTENWEQKQVTSGPAWWRERIRFRMVPTNVVFIPHMFRDAEGRWHNAGKIRQSILIDRFRLMRMLSDAGDASLPRTAAPFVDLAVDTDDCAA